MNGRGENIGALAIGLLAALLGSFLTDSAVKFLLVIAIFNLGVVLGKVPDITAYFDGKVKVYEDRKRIQHDDGE